MRVIIVNDFARVNGGAAQVAITSASELARRGHQVVFFSAVGPVAPELMGRTNLEVVCLGGHEILTDPNRLRAAIRGIWNCEAGKVLRQVLARAPPGDALVHIHGWSKALSASVVPEIARAGLPSVVTLHDYFAACPNGAFFDYQRSTICRLRPLSVACLLCHCDSRAYVHKLWRVARQVVQEVGARMPAAIRHFIYLSELSRDILKPFLPRDAELHFVRNPIEAEKGDPVAVEHNSTFTAIGRLAPEKGYALFAEAGLRLGVPVAFVGDGPVRSNLKRINPNASFSGWVDRQQVSYYLARARALVFPSVWYECHPLVIREAAACGVPAIVADTSAARELVSPNVTGLWFKGGDATDLKRKMEAMLDPALAKRLGRAAYDLFWSDSPTPSGHVDELERVYTKMLSPNDWAAPTEHAAVASARFLS